MDRRPGDRIFGIETEFGCLVDDPSIKPERIVEDIKNYIFLELNLGAIDLHARDEVFEPMASGGFMINGSRLYIDAVGSHLEYATAECRNLDDVLLNDRAGQRIIVRALKELGLEETVRIYNNSIDHFGGHTFGCHENYLVQMSENFFNEDVNALFAFLVTRQIFAGVGRVGGHVLIEGGEPSYKDMNQNPIDYIWVSQVYHVFPDEEVNFQLSQRADHILRTVASRVRFNRALINPKWEHFYAHEGMNRMHLLFGEANQSAYAYKLKVGTTNLVLQLLEDGELIGEPELAQPLLALRDLSRDDKYQWRVLMEDGTETSALDIQYRLRELAGRYAGVSDDVDWVLQEWAYVLDRLKDDPMSLGDRLDWVAKKQMIDAFVADGGAEWGADVLHSLDLEYHNINPEQSLFYALPEGTPARQLDELDVVDAMTDAPRNTRAFGRSHLVERAVKRGWGMPYMFDWSSAVLGRRDFYEMPDPFDNYERFVEADAAK
ncbi:MAG: proteasome accessory factor PafA2 family protein [Fimbriimonadaceae bacterium]